MKLERALRLNSRELAAMLRDWADKLDSGIEIDVAGMSVNLPDELRVEVGYKEKNSKAKVKLKVTWPEVGRGSGPGVPHEHGKSDIKWIKEEMGELLNSLRRGIESGVDASLADAERFRELSALFLERAKPAWRPGAAEVVKTAGFLIEAVTQGKKETVRQRLDELAGLRRHYHDSFK